MKTYGLIEKLMCVAMMLSLSNLVLGKEDPKLICPASLKPSKHFTSIPYGFDYKRQTVSYVAIDTITDEAQQWFVLLYAIPVTQLENNHERASAVMQELTPVSPTPFIWHFKEDHALVPTYYCVYTHPVFKKVNAVAFVDDSIDFDDEQDLDISRILHKRSKHAKIMLAARSFLR